MKKLMIAAAIVCAAAVSQAASINWNVGGATWKRDGGADPTAKMTMYLIDASAWSTIESAIKNGARSFTVEDTGILDVAQTSNNTKGQVSTRTATPMKTITTDPFVQQPKLTPGTSYDFSYLVIDGDKYFASASIPQQAYDPADATYSDVKSITFGNSQFSGTESNPTLSGGWQTAAVPEPTSALLLLLGVAGVALKRKRA